MSWAILVAGTTSNASKSLVTAGLCRWLRRKGVRVAPFKAQNMSNNSMVCTDGAEIGRAQWLQAVAAGAEPEAAMNPVLLKPGTDRRSHIVLLGRPHGELRAEKYATGRTELAEATYASLADLRHRYDVVVCEGAGSPTEINLRAGDYANMGLARRAQWPVVVVGDIDRGGVFAAMFGSLALLDAADQALVAGWIVNKLRGDPALLRSGLYALNELTGRPVLGVLPWLADLWLDAEDSLAAGWADRAPGPAAAGALRVVVVRLPRMSNTTDLDALATEPGVAVTLTADPDAVATADLAILPGTRATVEDLEWLREHGIADAITGRAAAGHPVLGICGGYQMLAEQIHDPVESHQGTHPGLALLPTTVDFRPDKTLGRPHGTWRDHQVHAYEIHHGVVTRSATTSGDLEPFIDGWRDGSVWGHHLARHLRKRRLPPRLAHPHRRHRLAWRPAPSAPGFAEQREACSTASRTPSNNTSTRPRPTDSSSTAPRPVCRSSHPARQPRPPRRHSHPERTAVRTPVSALV